MRSAIIVLCLFADALCQAQTSVNTVTMSEATIPTYNTTNVTQQVNTFQTEIKARMQGGSYLYDQTFSSAYSSATVQAAITQAESVLTGAGAVSFVGPTQLSSNQSTSTSTATTQNTVTTGVTVSVTTYIGPQTIEIGNLGYCPATAVNIQQNYAASGCTGGSPVVLNIVPGGQDIDTLYLGFETITQTVTTTNTTLTSAVYEIDGVASGTTTPVTPAPASWILMLVGLAGLSFYAAWRKSGPRESGKYYGG